MFNITYNLDLVGSADDVLAIGAGAYIASLIWDYIFGSNVNGSLGLMGIIMIIFAFHVLLVSGQLDN